MFKVNIFNSRGQSFDTEEIKNIRDKSILSNPVATINIDREKDKDLREKLHK